MYVVGSIVGFVSRPVSLPQLLLGASYGRAQFWIKVAGHAHKKHETLAKMDGEKVAIERRKKGDDLGQLQYSVNCM